MRARPSLLLFVLVLTMALAGCPRAAAPAEAGQPQKHHHHPPHGGTAVVLGDEDYHMELVLDGPAGRLQAFILDGEMENFVRTAAPAIEIDATVGGAPRSLVLAAVPNPETGETVGDTSLFEGQADWLKVTPRFDAVLRSVTIRGTTFSSVKFNFPKGNDTD